MRNNGQALLRLDGTAAEPVLTLPVGDALSVTAAVDGTDGPREVLNMLVLAGFTTGHEPYAHTVHLENVRAEAALLPEGGRVAREVVDGNARAVLALGEGWTLLANRWQNTRQASVTATAVSAELAESVVRRATEGAVADPPEPDGAVPIGFWHHSGNGPRRRSRRIGAAEWAQVRGNYSARVARAVDELMSTSAQTLRGRLILLHGPPGTGKTTLLRVLARQWQSWCQVDCVLDPETLFSNPAYLMDVALGADDNGKGERWRLLLLEDCDELVRGEAKRATGQALSRLLNLTDGIVGQGRNVLVAVTTNEDMAALHPAISRPGRCLARIEVGPLSREEASAWLAAGGAAGAVGSHGATLAELFALRDGVAQVESSEPAPRHGVYL